MDNNEFDFTKDFMTPVKFKLPQIKTWFEGQLNVAQKKLPILIPNQNQLCFQHLQMLEKQKESFQLECKSNDGTYTLFSCEAFSSQIHPQFIIKDLGKKNIDGIEVEFLGLVDWIYWFGLRTEEWMDHDLFSLIVPIDGQQFRISGRCYCRGSFDQESNNQPVITIRLRCLNGSVTVESAEQLCRSTQRLFSLLLSLPISIKACWLLTKRGRKPLPFHFWNHTNTDNPFKENRNVLIYYSYIDKHFLWASLFTCFFSDSNTFKSIWPRLIYLFNYKGAWEYELLGYVSVLDAFVNNYTEKKGKKIGEAIFKAMKKSLIAVIEQYKVGNPNVSPMLFEGYKEGLKQVKNTEFPTFAHKFEFLMREVNEDIQAIIGFTTSEFTTIKKIRDAVAHGLPIPVGNPRNITEEMVIRDKLRLLLIYFIHQDFGFTPLQFAHFLSGPSAPFVRNARINHLRLDQFAGEKSFYPLSPDDYELALRLSKSGLGLVLNVPANSESLYTVNEEVSQMRIDWSRSRTQPVVQWEEYLNQNRPDLAARITFSSGYVFCGQNYSEIHMGIGIIK